ncbi:NRAMP family divalent metal transporter [Haloarcula nitratireducens]|uniref:Divalent metal cation transporter n=1 Tax=Haloarcula nitratireducens TaxID=2487749 RepID=A0AAW4P9Y0_9EURY|nr:divalent metal cation transporter [Halomicroarcula nitratireducens]MBX0294767.1 divalent metal cation transporter [Halomicroarcula nitratireducens]
MAANDARGLRERLSGMGPTWLAGAIATGPATIGALVTAGASFDYALLWVVVLSAVMGATAQYLAMRLGLLTEAGIVAAVEENLGDAWAWLLVADTVVAAGVAQLVIMKTLAGVSAEIAGLNPVPWAVFWGVVLAAGLARGGYKYAEFGAKVLVSLVVVLFVASLFVVPIDYGAAAAGLVPAIPAGVEGALLAAGILGGAVHIALVTMQSYTMRARGWTVDDADLAVFDVGASMLVAFGIASLAIFLVAASVLGDPGLGAVGAATALGPLVGSNAKWLFLLGLWGAAVTTLGGNTAVPPYVLADKMGWAQDTADPRYRAAVAAFALLSVLGVFIPGAVFGLLIQALAIGFVGTPFVLALVLYLLNDPTAVPETNSLLENVGGLLVVGISTVVAGQWVRRVASGGVADPVSLAVLAFAAILAAAMVGLAALFTRDWLRDGDERAVPAD